VDHEYFLASHLLECIYGASTHKQRYRRVAPWSPSTRRKEDTASLLFTYSAPAAGSKLTALQFRLVSERKLRKVLWKSMQAKVFKLWDDYNSWLKSARKLLKACADIVVQARSLLG